MTSTDILELGSQSDVGMLWAHPESGQELCRWFELNVDLAEHLQPSARPECDHPPRL